MPPWLDSLWYRFWYWVAFILFTLGFSLRLERRERIPRRGPVLIIANHESFIDPILLGLAATRPLSYLARRTLFKPRWFAWLIRSFGAVPVDQEGFAREGLRTVLQHLQEGRAVVVFPEGTRTRTGELSPLRPGVLLLLHRLDMTVVPVGIAGAFEAMPLGRKIPRLSPLLLPASGATLAVAVGRPLDSRRFRDMPRDQALAELATELRKVRDQAKRARRKT